MAQLNDTMVQGDLRVTGKIYGTDNAMRLENADLAIPPLGAGDYVGSTGDFFIGSGSGKNLPDTTNNFNIHTTVTHFTGTTYSLSQIATPTSPNNPTGLYERGGISSDGITWTFGSWATYNNYTLPVAASGTRGGIQIGYSESGTNYAVKLSSEKAYVSVPWTDTKVTQTKDDSGTTAYPLLMAGATDPNGSATTSRYDSGVKLTPSTNTISANISGNAATATNADYVNLLHTNEVNFKNVPTSGNTERVWFNYRNGDTDEPDASNLITQYYFGNRNKVTTGVTLMADNFSGNAATASAAQTGSALETAINGKLDFAEKDFALSGSWNNQLNIAMLRILNSPKGGTSSSPENGTVFALVGATESHGQGFVSQLAFGDEVMYYRVKHKPKSTWVWSDWKNVVTSDNSIKQVVVSDSVGTEDGVIYFT